MVELSDLRWDERGLLPVVIQDVRTGEVLMLARMNREALARTRRTGVVHLWDEAAGEMVEGGEATGSALHVVEVRVNCQADALLLQVNAAGPACRSGERSCFHRCLAPPRSLSAIAWGRDAAEGDEQNP
ncbi:MAG: phosphoribosyl-AMP cyclohydrolase [Anaerolineae bacterium]|nr:phosphoribosyl-AMP cyclohydrolase [Anaerolineae bacterium]